VEAASVEDEHDLLVGGPNHLTGCVFLLRPRVFHLIGPDVDASAAAANNNNKSKLLCGAHVAAATAKNNNTTSTSDTATAAVTADLTLGFGTSLAQLLSLGPRAVAVGAPDAAGGVERLWLLRGLGADLSIPPNNTVLADTTGSSSSSSSSHFPAVVLVDTSRLNLLPGMNELLFSRTVTYLDCCRCPVRCHRQDGLGGNSEPRLFVGASR
jgi:hypothetical protein